VLLVVLTTLPGASAAQTLQMVYRDKPPYSYLDKGVAKGFLLDRTRRIMRRAGLDAAFREMPPKRIFLEIEKNEYPVCSFGWYRLAERERYARYSESIHQDRPHVVVVGPHSIEKVRRHSTLGTLMNDRSLLGLVGAKLRFATLKPRNCSRGAYGMTTCYHFEPCESDVGA
jgi:hypothetical protein